MLSYYRVSYRDPRSQFERFGYVEVVAPSAGAAETKVRRGNPSRTLISAKLVRPYIPFTQPVED